MDVSTNLNNQSLQTTSGVSSNQVTIAVSPSQVPEIQGQIRLSELNAGQSILGRIVNVEQDPVVGRVATIDLGENSLVQASIAQDMQLTDGQLLLFQVKSTSGGMVELSPLMENTASSPTVTKALSEAGLPETDLTKAMVNEMMREGMRIDPKSLQAMFQELSRNPDIPVSTSVQMAKLQIPITAENAQQFLSYQNYEHQVLSGIETIGELLPETYAQMQADGEGAAALDLYGNVLQLFTEQEEESGEAPQVENQAAVRLMQEMDSLGSANGNLDTAVTARLQQVAQFLEEGTLSASDTQKLLGAVATLYEQTAHTSEQIDGAFTRLFGESKFGEAVQSALEKSWMIKPEDVESKQTVEKLYERLHEQTQALTRALKGSVAEASPLAQNVKNLSQNVDFINQLNHTMAYIQLPLKMADQNAHGDLYVYSNKRNLAESDGEVSAVLHLELDHLGMTDVYVKMKDNNVQTRFYMEDDAALDLVIAHIDELTERLNKRGYNMDAKVMLQTDKEPSENSVLDMVMQRDMRVSKIAQTSFDARV